METLQVIVADTHVVVWLALEPEQISATARSAIEQARIEGGLGICGVTLYEIAWLVLHGRVDIDSSEAFLSNVQATFIVLPITSKIAQLAAALPENFPGDPMDRMIAATALDNGVPLITRDKAIRRSKAVKVIW